MGKVMLSGIVPPLVAPVTGIQLGDIAEGSIVNLNENGSPAEFYVAKHDYESALNGAGRTLLVRKDCYDARAWHSPNVNAYASSVIDAWLNGDYKALLDAGVQNIIGATKFYYTPGNGDTTVVTLERSIFLLSVTELGLKDNYANVEGTALPISSTLRMAYLNGSLVNQWTRSPKTDVTNRVWESSTNGGCGYNFCTYAYGSRPAFTLPSGACFDEETMLFNGKIA